MALPSFDSLASSSAGSIFSVIGMDATYSAIAGGRYAWRIILDKSVDPRPADFDNYGFERQTLLSVRLSDIPHDTAAECRGGSVTLFDGCRYQIDDLDTDDGIEARFKVIPL